MTYALPHHLPDEVPEVFAVQTRLSFQTGPPETDMLVDRYEIHRFLCDQTGSDRKNLETLFYRENRSTLLVQTSQDVEWRDSRILSSETFFVPLLYPEKTVLVFRLLARPFQKIQKPGRKNRSRSFLYDPVLQTEWLRKQGQRLGFVLLDCIPRYETWFERRDSEKLPATLFTGTLAVSDAKSFSRCLLSGIGPQKHLGFGLLDVRRHR